MCGRRTLQQVLLSTHTGWGPLELCRSLMMCQGWQGAKTLPLPYSWARTHSRAVCGATQPGAESGSHHRTGSYLLGWVGWGPARSCTRPQPHRPKLLAPGTPRPGVHLRTISPWKARFGEVRGGLRRQANPVRPAAVHACVRVVPTAQRALAQWHMRVQASRREAAEGIFPNIAVQTNPGAMGLSRARRRPGRPAPPRADGLHAGNVIVTCACVCVQWRHVLVVPAPS